MADDLRIRPLKMGDRSAVRRIVRATWGADDYIPLVFTEWVRDGGFLGAELDGELVGFAKLTRMSPTEAFLEGLRVTPKARGRGVGSALVAARVDRARSRGMRVARFVTWSENPAMHRLGPRFGFRRVTEDEWARARPRRGPALRAAIPDDVDPLLALARTSGRLFRVDHHASRFRELTRRDIADAARTKRCLVLDGPAGPRAFAVLGPGRARAVFFAALPRATAEFARRYRGYAATRPRTKVFLAFPRSDRRAVASAGYRLRRRGYGVVYERDL